MIQYIAHYLSFWPLAEWILPEEKIDDPVLIAYNPKYNWKMNQTLKLRKSDTN